MILLRIGTLLVSRPSVNRTALLKNMPVASSASTQGKRVSADLSYRPKICSLSVVERAPRQVPSFPLQANAKSWYRRLSQVGFHYGPSFQTMTEVHTDQNSNAVVSETRVQQVDGSGEKEPHFHIHPGTVDACLQSIIASIYAGKLGRVTHGFVPVHIDSMSAYTAKDHGDQKSTTVNTWVESGEDRHYAANSQMTWSNGRLLLDFEGVHCVAYEAVALPLLKENQPGTPYWQTRWLPSLDLNTTTEALQALETPNVTDIIGLLCHDNISTKVLDVGGGYVKQIIEKYPWIDVTVIESYDEQPTLDDAGTTTIADKRKSINLRSLKDTITAPSDVEFDLIIDTSPFNFQPATSDTDIHPEYLDRENVQLYQRMLSPNGILLLSQSMLSMPLCVHNACSKC